MDSSAFVLLFWGANIIPAKDPKQYAPNHNIAVILATVTVVVVVVVAVVLVVW